MKVLIATPAYNSMCTMGYTSSMINLFKLAPKHDLEIDFIYGLNEALVTYARNMCANIFLKSDATHLLFIDADIQFDAEQIIKLIKSGEKKDIVCGIYPKKKIDWDKVKEAALRGNKANMLQGLANEYLVVPSNNTVPDENGLIEIERAATGMMLIRRNVFDSLSNKVDKFNLVSPVQSNIKFENEELYKEFFFTSIDNETNIFLHEDFTFCKMWRETGGKIYGAPWVRLFHIGNHIYG